MADYLISLKFGTRVQYGSAESASWSKPRMNGTRGGLKLQCITTAPFSVSVLFSLQTTEFVGSHSSPYTVAPTTLW